MLYHYFAQFMHRKLSLLQYLNCAYYIFKRRVINLIRQHFDLAFA